MPDAQDGSLQKNLNYEVKYAGVMVYCKNAILLAKRIEKCPITNKTTDFPGYWSIFCGSIEKGESPIECAQRELFEETKINVEINDLQYMKDSGELSIYKYELDSLVLPELNFEHTESGWFMMDSINILPEPIDKKIINLIELHKLDA